MVKSPDKNVTNFFTRSSSRQATRDHVNAAVNSLNSINSYGTQTRAGGVANPARKKSVVTKNIASKKDVTGELS